MHQSPEHTGCCAEESSAKCFSVFRCGWLLVSQHPRSGNQTLLDLSKYLGVLLCQSGGNVKGWVTRERFLEAASENRMYAILLEPVE